MHSRRTVLWLSLALAALTILVFFPVWRFEFVSLDDPWYVTQNPEVLRGLSWTGVLWALTTGRDYYWHPLTWLSHMLDVQLYGLSAGGHHLTNLVIHVATVLLLFTSLRRLTGAVGRSAFMAAAFAVHPLHVEPVAWVAERKEVLSALFWMVTLLAYERYARDPRWNRYLATLGCFALGLMAKPMIVTLPLVLLLLDLWPLGRLGGDAPMSMSGTPWTWHRVWPLLREKIPFFALALVSGIVTFLNQYEAGAVRELGGGFSLPFRLANALVSYVAYIASAIWPSGLAAFYPYPRSLPGWTVVGAALLLLTVSVLVLRASARRPYLPVGWAWYLLTLLPVIGLVQVGDQAMADRFVYIPLIGLSLIVAWGVPDLLGVAWPHADGQRPARTALGTGAARRASLAMAIAALVVTGTWAAGASAQVRYWQDSQALWERAAAVTQDNQRAHANLAELMERQGNVPRAMEEYAEAIRIVPRATDLRKRLALLLIRDGRLPEAAEQLTTVVRLDPQDAEAYNNLGVILEKQGRPQEAMAAYGEAVRANPGNALAHANLADALAQSGRPGDAVQEYRAALHLEPRRVAWRFNLAMTLYRLGLAQDATRELRTVIEIDPAFEPARSALQQLGR